MHVGLTGPLCPLPRPESWEPCPSKEVPHCPRLRLLMSLRSIKKGSQINMPECHQGFTLMQTQGLRFPPQPRYLSNPPPPKRSSPPRSPYGAPASRKMFHHQSPLYMSLSHQKRNPLQVPLTEPLRRGRCSISRAFLISNTVPRKEPPPPPGSP
jgi:hypothetical protein